MKEYLLFINLSPMVNFNYQLKFEGQTIKTSYNKGFSAMLASEYILIDISLISSASLRSQ